MNKLSSIEIKALALDKGVTFSQRFIEAFGRPFLEKRRAYGNSDSLKYLHSSIPQEFYILPEKLICAVNCRDESEVVIDFNGVDFTIGTSEHVLSTISFPLHPVFYDNQLSDGTPAKKIGTLYGGAALGLFVYGSCTLVQNNVGCKYCSIKPNKDFGRDFAHSLNEQQVYETVDQALTSDPSTISQIMINGGIFKDYDKGFMHYVRLCAAARKALDKHKSKAELHLISYPPNNLELLHHLEPLDLSIAMNSEVFNEQLFLEYCPGKSQKHIRNALTKAVSILGKGKVYSICVGGLEPMTSLQSGLEELAELGVTPVINVFHPDPKTPLESHPTPSACNILEMGRILQNIYNKHSYMKPFYDDCGRNSIDSEAHKGLF